MATEAAPAPAPSDHPAQSEEVERKPRSEAKDMEAETEGVESVKHEDSACPVAHSTESQPEREEHVEDDIRPKAEAPVDVATASDETIEKKIEDIIDNKALELPSAEEENRTQVAEHKPLELPTTPDEDKLANAPISEPESERGEGKSEKEVLQEEAVETTEAKDVTEDKFKEVSPAIPVAEEKPPEKVESELEDKLETVETTEFKAEEVSRATPVVEEKPPEKVEIELEEKLETAVEENIEKEEPAEAVKTIGAKDVTESECRAEEISLVEEKPSEEAERKLEAKDMEAETEGVESVKHEDSACPAAPSTEPQPEREERVEDDIRPKGEAPVDVATVSDETIEIKSKDIIDNKALELPSAEEEPRTQVAEHKPLELPTTADDDKLAEVPISEPRTETADSKPESERGEGKIEKQVLQEETVETTEAKDVMEDEFKAEEVSPATHVVQEKSPEKVECELEEKLETAVEEKIEKEEPAEAVKTIGAKDVTESECRGEQVSPAAPIVEEKPPEEAERELEEKLETTVDEKLEKEVPAEAVKTIGAKDVTEDECRAEQVSPGAPIVEEKPYAKARVIEAEPLGEVEVKIQTLPKEEESGATENPTFRVEEEGVECYPTEEVKEKTGKENEPPAKETNEVKEKVSSLEKIEATSDEKSGATEEFVQFEENPTGDANVAEDEVTDRDIKLIADNAKTEAHNKEANEEMEKSVAADNTKEAVQATGEKIDETAGAIKAELKGEIDARSSDPLPELIVENVKSEADTKEASEETDRTAEKTKEPVQASEEAIKAELEVENQVDKPVNDAKSSDPLHEVIDENAKTEADDDEPSDELEKNVAAESIKENVQDTEVKVKEIVGAAKGELEGEKQGHVNDAKNSDLIPELIAENATTEADNKEASEEMNKNVTAEKIIVPVQATEDKIEETVRAIKSELEGEKHVDEAVNDAISAEPLPEITAKNTKTEADNKELSDELEKDVVAESIKEAVQATEVKLEETIGTTIKAGLEGEKQVDEPVNDAKSSYPLPELIAEHVRTEADTKEAGEDRDTNVTAENIKEPVEATEEKIEEIVEAIKDELEGEKQEPVNDAKISDPLPELVLENAETEADDKKTSEETNKNVAAAKLIEPVQATEEKIEETVGAMKAELEGEKQDDEPVKDARSSYPLPELIAENAKTKADNNESTDEQEKNVAAESINKTVMATEVKIEEIVRATEGELEGEKQAPVNAAKNSDPLPELIAEDAKTEADNKEASEEANKNVAAEKIVEPIQATGEKIEETFGAIKAELEGEKQVDEPVNDTRSLDPLPEPIAENAKTEAYNKDASDEPEKNVAAECIKETVQATEEKIEEIVGATEGELEGEKQAPVNDAKNSNPLPELIAEHAKTEDDNKEASEEANRNVGAEKIVEPIQATGEKIEETFRAIKPELEGEKQFDEPVNDTRSSDPLPEPIAENTKTEAYNDSSEEPEKNVVAESIKETVQATEVKIEETVGAIKGELEGEKQVDEPVRGAKISVPLPELDAENAKTEVDNKEASKGTDQNVAVEKIKGNVQATDLKIEETVGAIKGELEGEKQVYEPVNDARSSDPLPELNAENVKTEADTKEASEEMDQNVAAEKIQEPVQATEEKIEETDGAIKAELEGGKQVDDPINDARSSDPLSELIAENAKTKADNKESSDEPDKNVAAESIKETLQPAELKIEETVGAIKNELEGEKQVEEPVKNPECINEMEDSKKPQDVPVKTHKQSIVKMVKQSLVKAKKAITGKSQNSKTPAEGN